MKLLHLKTRLTLQVEILEVESTDFALIKKSKQFEFDWAKEKENHVFKIVKAEEEEETLGLL